MLLHETIVVNQDSCLHLHFLEEIRGRALNATRKALKSIVFDESRIPFHE